LIFEGEGYPLRELSIAGGSIRDLPFGEEAGSLTISAKSEQLAYDIQSGGDSNIWRRDLFHPQTLSIKLIFTLAVTYRKNGGREGTRTPGPCLQSRPGKTLNALSGVAYTENWRNSRSLKCPEVVPSLGLGWIRP
jgi:hypothetical protein